MVKLALAGCGGWGKNLARNLAELGVLDVIADPGPHAAAMAHNLGVRHVNTVDEILRDTAIAGLVIATPAVTHAAVAEAAMRAGKDVFIEKPIALAPEDGRKLGELAKLTGRVLMVGHLLQYHPVFIKLKELVKSGALGRIRHISSSRLNLGLLRTEENVVWSFAPHDISMVLALAGAEPERVSAIGTTILQEGIPDIATVHMTFGDGLKADVTSSWLHPQKEQKLIVVGDDGMAVFADTKPWAEKLCIYRNRVEWTDQKPKAIAGPMELIEVAQGEPLRMEMEHFIYCIENRALPRTDAAEANRVLAVLEASQTSLDAQGDWVDTVQQNEIR
jgi:UDP-2-acetamido-3-amino-2,3-dideoxy-glucuronate N-acetyltransferase